MKIINKRVESDTKPLRSAIYGSVVQFTKRFNNTYPPEELFLVLCVNDAYFPTKYDMQRDKQGVACLSNGNLSYVDSNRTVTVMKSEVTVNGPEKT